jgi:hypothetical protein
MRAFVLCGAMMACGASGVDDTSAGDTDASGSSDTPSTAGGVAALRINEVLADNAGAWSVDGATPDGIELYNAGPTSVDLAGYAISDDPDDPTLHTWVGSWVIPAGGFVLLWADEGARGGPESLPFALSSDGDRLVLTDPEARRLDALRFGAQEPDVALARRVDGDEASGWVYVQDGTPGASNAGAGQP